MDGKDKAASPSFLNTSLCVSPMIQEILEAGEESPKSAPVPYNFQRIVATRLLHEPLRACQCVNFCILEVHPALFGS